MNVFTYGTLMDPKVFYFFSSNKYEEESVILKGYQRRHVKNAYYPGIIPSPEHSTKGKLYKNVVETDLAKLDHYEGDQYKKTMVKVENEKGEALDAVAYEFKNPENLMDCDWISEVKEK